MPEGPEVRRLGMQLAKRISGRNLLDIKILSGRYQTHGSPTGLEKFLEWTPVRIRGAGVHGKFIYILLDAEWSVWCTLGMTGSWTHERQKHSRLELILTDGSIFFTDPRNFGTLKFVKGKQPLIDKLESLGPDMLAESIGVDMFTKRILRRPTRTIAEALMDQATLAGVGNYVKAESLYLAKISPHRPCENLTRSEMIVLHSAVTGILAESFELGGATINTYTDMSGDAGEFSRKFAVYGQKTDPQGNEVVKEKTRDGRVTHWVPDIQK